VDPVDPETGDRLGTQRERGWLTLAVTEPPGPGTEGVVTRYPLGRWAAPGLPPLFRHLGSLDGIPPASWRLRPLGEP
jgi:hypothetical protein